MVGPVWREELKEKLGRQGLPPTYIERLVQELCDHLNDVMEESMSMEAEKSSLAAERLGQPSKLAAAAGTEYRKRVVHRNSSVVMFAVLPLLLLPMLWAGLWAGLFVADSVLTGGVDGVPTSYLHLRIISYGTTGMILVPPVILSVIFCRFAKVNGTDWRWPMLTTSILSVLVGLICWTVLPWGPIKEPKLVLIVGLPITIQQWLQSLLIFAVGGGCCLRSRRPQTIL